MALVAVGAQVAGRHDPRPLLHDEPEVERPGDPEGRQGRPGLLLVDRVTEREQAHQCGDGQPRGGGHALRRQGLLAVEGGAGQRAQQRRDAVDGVPRRR